MPWIILALVVNALTHAADLYTTHVGLARGAVEVNPLMRRAWARYALKLALVGGITALALWLWGQDRQALALAVTALCAVVGGAAAGKNCGTLTRRS